MFPSKTDTPAIRVVLDHRCLLGEGPVWDARQGLICWIDILNGEIHQVEPTQTTHSTVQVYQPIGSFALCQRDSRFVAAIKDGFCFIDRQTGAVSMIANPEASRPGNRFNEGKCDPAGRFWAGTMSLIEEPEAGSVYTLNPDLSVTRKIGKVTISNGMAWSLGHSQLYYIDTPTFTVKSFLFNNKTGQLGPVRTVLDIPEQEGYPDGMTIDNEGMLWIAHWDGWQITRWNPNTGEILLRLPLPVAKVTSCTFGGPTLGDLYITTARVGLSEKEIEEQPLAGSLFVWPDCGFTGMSAFEFDA
ncbi:SMP-30/gluconolactonase/LRE family protein [Spirosoma pollinicola]|uniref:Regucalcin n=1 Tax=Spirosoma pollinicola TaxID=2057025 RepID=A0A2K8YRZ9_9BACT|nr:SMP-30/gluconolactonase/LRE family protein [Spirosoma pollinicola]AUD00354.1 SMP-30/gluconolaconase/LRE domain protein [Spirosoma pollinicola]